MDYTGFCFPITVTTSISRTDKLQQRLTPGLAAPTQSPWSTPVGKPQHQSTVQRTRKPADLYRQSTTNINLQWRILQRSAAGKARLLGRGILLASCRDQKTTLSSDSKFGRFGYAFLRSTAEWPRLLSPGKHHAASRLQLCWSFLLQESHDIGNDFNLSRSISEA